MSNCRMKSEENLSAAALLIRNNCNTSSVHCSYYAGFQYSKYVLANYCNINYEDQEQQSKGRDSHFFVCQQIGKNIDNKGKHLNFIDYNRYYNKLKMLRKKADYSENIINSDEATKALIYANDLIKILNNTFQIL